MISVTCLFALVLVISFHLDAMGRGTGVLSRMSSQDEAGLQVSRRQAATSPFTGSDFVRLGFHSCTFRSCGLEMMATDMLNRSCCCREYFVY